MIKKLFLVALMILSVNIIQAQANSSPVLSNFRIENTNKNRIYFDSSEPITASSSTGFYLSDNLRKKITGINVVAGATSGHYFTSSAAFDYWDTYAIRYEGGSNIMDLNSNPVNDFWLTEIDNKIPEPAPSGTPYWVRTTGSDSADGLSHATAFKTINKAMSLNANTIYIEVGDYGAEQLDFNYDGTATNPIVVQGYKTYTSGNAPDPITSNYWSWGSYGTGTNVTVDTSEMPTLTGNTTLRNTNYETAVTPSNYMIIKNIQVINWNIGFHIRSRHHMTLKNITTVYTGSATNGIGAAVYVVGGSGSDTDTFNKFIDMQIAQCAVVGIRLYGGGALFDNVNVNADRAFGDGYDTPDYYMSIYHGSNNVIKNCSVGEIGADIGSSHGIGFKTGSTPHANCTEYNLVTDCTARNMQGALELRHADVANNVFRNIDVFSLPEDGAISATGNGSHGIVVRDGSHHNYFENITLDSQYRAIYFTDTVEQGDQTNGHDCTFRNIEITNCAIFLATNGKTSVRQAYNNHFYNLTIDSITDEMYWSNGSIVIMDNTNTLTNTSISNCVSSVGNTSIVQSHNNYHNNRFVTPSGTNITTHDPQFINPNNGDFHLQPTSPIKDLGLNVSQVNFDKEGVERFNGEYSIGAYEDTAPRIGSVSPSSVTICEGENVTLIASGGTSYSWSTGETSDSITVSPSSTTTYSVTISDGINSDSHDVIITVNTPPMVNAGSDQTICEGESVTLTATGEGNFLWSTGETTETISVSPTSTTTYTVTASNSCSTDATDEVIVTVTPGVTLDAGSDVSICSGESVTLTATGTGPFNWSTGETTASITVNPSSTTTYSITSTNGSCSLSDDVTVTVNTTPTVNAGSDQTICEGESVILTATGEGNFLWSTGETTETISVSPTSTTTYTVTASNSCSTDATDEVIVTVTPGVTLDAGPDVSICLGENNVTLTATGTGPFDWSTGETTATITVNPAITTTYSVTSTNGSCSLTDEVTVTVNTSPSVNLGNDVTICSGEDVTLTAVGEGNFLWSTGETTESITVSPTITTTYSVTASNSCSGDAEDQITVTVNETPIVVVSDDITIEEGSSTELIAVGEGSFIWSTGETTSSITVNPSETTTYSVTLTSAEGCSDVGSVVVSVNNSSSNSVIANAGADQEICLNATATLTATGGESYLWSTGETTQSITVSPTETTIYTVTVSNGNSIDVDDVMVVVDEGCSGTGNRSVNRENKIYPNPTEGELNVELTGYDNESIVSIYDLNGRLVHSENIDNFSPIKIIKRQMNLTRFGKGVYFIRIINNNITETKKILVI